MTEVSEKLKKEMTETENIRRFIRGGKSRFTLRSKKTGTRYTYMVKKAKDGDVHFIFSLYGNDNTSAYSYLGMLKDKKLQLTRASKFKADSPQVKALDWSMRKIETEDIVPNELEFWHEGRCARCGRPLTVPESIETGFGPKCYTMEE